MEFMRCKNAPSMSNSSTTWNCYHRDPNKFIFTVELCGIWLGELPRNQHLEATLLPPHMSHAFLQHYRLNKLSEHRGSQQFGSDYETVLPQKSSRKHNSINNSNTMMSSDPFFKISCFESGINSGLSFYPYALQLEACRIFGSMHFSNGCLIFSSKDTDLKIPTHLGGPGDINLCNHTSPKIPRQTYEVECKRSYSESVNHDFGVSDWMLNGEVSASCQSLITAPSSQQTISSSSFSSSPTTLLSPAVKKGIRQFLAFLSKKPKHLRQLETNTLIGSTRTCTESHLVGMSIEPSGIGIDSTEETLRFDWPLHTLRQFAFHGCLFKMETGRRAPNGEGHYLFRVRNMDEFRQTLEAHIRNEKRTRSLKSRSMCCTAPFSLTTCQLSYANLPPPVISPRVGHRGSSRFTKRPWSQLIPTSTPESPPHLPRSPTAHPLPAVDRETGNTSVHPPIQSTQISHDVASNVEIGPHILTSSRAHSLFGGPRRLHCLTDEENAIGGGEGEGLQFSHFQIDADDALPVISETQSQSGSTCDSAASDPVTVIRGYSMPSDFQTSSKIAAYENVKSIVDQLIVSSPQTPKLMRFDEESMVKPGEEEEGGGQPFSTVQSTPTPGRLNYASLDFHRFVTEPIPITNTSTLSTDCRFPYTRFERLSKSTSVLNTSTLMASLIDDDDDDDDEIPLTCHSDTQTTKTHFQLFAETRGDDDDDQDQHVSDYVDICPLQTMAINEILKNTI